MAPQIKEEKKSCNKQKFCYISKRKFSNYDDKKCHKVSDLRSKII